MRKKFNKQVSGIIVTRKKSNVWAAGTANKEKKSCEWYKRNMSESLLFSLIKRKKRDMRTGVQ